MSRKSEYMADLIPNLIGAGIAAIIFCTFLGIAFFDRGSVLFDAIHPFSILDGIGLIGFCAITVFFSGVWKLWLNEAWVDGVHSFSIGVYLVCAGLIALIFI